MKKKALITFLIIWVLMTIFPFTLIGGEVFLIPYWFSGGVPGILAVIMIITGYLIMAVWFALGPFVI